MFLPLTSSNATDSSHVDKEIEGCSSLWLDSGSISAQNLNTVKTKSCLTLQYWELWQNIHFLASWSKRQESFRSCPVRSVVFVPVYSTLKAEVFAWGGCNHSQHWLRLVTLHSCGVWHPCPSCYYYYHIISVMCGTDEVALWQKG